MIECTNKDNLDNFLEDLKAVIEMAHSLKNLAGAVMDTEEIPRGLIELESNGFEWIDDGKHDIKIKFGYKNNNESNHNND